MSTVLFGQDVLLVGDPTYECATVDVSSGTPCGTRHLNNARYHREHFSLPDTQNSTRPYQLSPHLQRNKQLQNTLIQKEEELARLQEENNKLKEFLQSAYVKSLKKKSKEFLFAQRSPELKKRKRTVNEEESRLYSEGIRRCHKLSLEFFSPKEVAATPPLDSWILQTLGLQNEGSIISDSCFSSPTTDQTSFCYQVTNINQKAFAGPDKQNSSICSAYSDTQCEYSSAKDSSGSMSHVETCTEYLTINTSPLYTVATGPLVNSLPLDTRHFTPPRAASNPHHLDACKLWQHCNRHDISSLPGNKDTLFYVPHTTESRIDLAFSMSLSPQNTVKTQSYSQGQAFTRRDSQGVWKFTWVPKHCS